MSVINASPEFDIDSGIEKNKYFYHYNYSSNLRMKRCV